MGLGKTGFPLQRLFEISKPGLKSNFGKGIPMELPVEVGLVGSRVDWLRGGQPGLGLGPGPGGLWALATRGPWWGGGLVAA